MKNFNIFSILVLIICTMLFVSCKDEFITSQSGNSSNENNFRTPLGDYETSTRPNQPMVLGKKLRNPYSTENMRAAFELLQEYPDSLFECMENPSVLKDLNIYCTNLYVRFLPKDTAEYDILMSDTTLMFFDYPLDYEIEEDGDYYIDPQYTPPFTWYYTKVSPDYFSQNNIKIKYEILDSLFLYEESTFYTSEMGAKDVTGINFEINDALKTIEAVAFMMTENKCETPNKQRAPSGTNYVTCTPKRFLWWRWTHCDYIPSGTIRVESFHSIKSPTQLNLYNTLHFVPVKGIQVRVVSWFRWSWTHTDSSGKYTAAQHYWLDPYYKLIYRGVRSAGAPQKQSWRSNLLLFDILSLWADRYSLGKHSKEGYSVDITEISGAWRSCINNNAFYDYMNLYLVDNVSAPPQSLHIALRDATGACSAPLFRNLADTVYVDSTFIPKLTWARLFLSVWWFTSDILIAGGELTTDHDDFQGFHCLVWHELAHASAFQRISTEVSKYYATSYWATYINAIVWNELKTKNSYGEKGDTDWQIIALQEGWAYYREWKMGRDFLKWNCLSDESWESDNATPYDKYKDKEPKYFPMYFSAMFFELSKIGCADDNMERALQARTLTTYAELLGSYYYAKRTQIFSIINSYQ